MTSRLRDEDDTARRQGGMGCLAVGDLGGDSVVGLHDDGDDHVEHHEDHHHNECRKIKKRPLGRNLQRGTSSSVSTWQAGADCSS
jgi:hypothetical protein